jgi:processive 1,2-diacylglycerol beta-glucosyltransferase
MSAADAGGPRVLILTADIGEGHDLPARVLADAIRARDPAAVVEVADSIRVAGPVVRAILRQNSELILARLTPLFDLQYWLVARFRPTRRLASLLAFALAGRQLLRAIATFGADVVVSTYPGTTEALGRARARGRLGVPLVSAITDLAALGFWAHPACDLHLITHAQSAAEVREIAGAGTRVEHVRGLTRPEFDVPRERAATRAALELPQDAPVVLVSGGGWGIGDLEGAVEEALAADEALVAICLCGRNEALRARLAARFGTVGRVRLLGFTDAISDLMAAADVLVHSTAGLTVLEAEVRGCHVISYGWGVGHVRVNNRAYARFGLAAVAADRPALAAALRAALAAPRAPAGGYGALPAAGDVVLELAQRGA